MGEDLGGVLFGYWLDLKKEVSSVPLLYKVLVLVLVYLFVDIVVIDFLHRRRYRHRLPPCVNSLGTGLIGRTVTLLRLGYIRYLNCWYDNIASNTLPTEHGVARIHVLGKPEIIILVNPPDTVAVLKTHFEKYEKGALFRSFLEDFLGEGIFAVDGHKWKAQRRSSSHMFKSRLMDTAAQIIGEHTQQLLNILERVRQDDQPIDVQDLFARFTLDCLFEIAFRQKLGCLSKETPFHRALDNVIYYIEERSLNPLFPWVDPWDGKIKENLKVVNDLAYSIIRKRIKEKKEEDAAEGKGEEEEEKIRGCDVLSFFLNHQDGDQYGDKELRDVVINFFLAGRDTTTQLFTWSTYLLSQHPQCEKELLDSLGGLEQNAIIDRQEAKTLAYLKAVLDESLRLYPPVPIDYKQCVQKDRLPSGYVVPEGDMIMWSAYAMGRSPKLWENPLKFQPERWLDPANPVNPQNHLPFQTGPRVCLGMNFAYMEAQIALGMIFRKYSFSLYGDEKPSLLTGVTPRAKNGMWMKVQKREG